MQHRGRALKADVTDYFVAGNLHRRLSSIKASNFFCLLFNHAVKKKKILHISAANMPPAHSESLCTGTVISTFAVLQRSNVHTKTRQNKKA